MKRYKVVSVIDSLFNAPFGQSFQLSSSPAPAIIYTKLRIPAESQIWCSASGRVPRTQLVLTFAIY